MANQIDSKTKREALAVRREPYWERLEPGLFLGFRRMDSGAGSWIARYRPKNGGQKYHSLGALTEIDEKGRFVGGSKEALKWARGIDHGVVEPDVTVRGACERYVTYLADKPGKATAADYAKDVFDKRVYVEKFAAFGATLLRQLKVEDVEGWRDAQNVGWKNMKGVSTASANRYFSVLKAAFNRAFETNLVDSNLAWVNAKNFKKVVGQRPYFLSVDERRGLLEAARPDLRALITAVLLTAARPGEIALADVSDFNKRDGLLFVNGKTGGREIVLSSAAIKFFTAARQDRIHGPLIRFDSPRGPSASQGLKNDRWNKELWKAGFRKARESAGLPKNIVLYHCRHAAISQQLEDGVDIFRVAKNAGTGVKMVEDFYGHIRVKDLRGALDNVNMI